MQKCQVHLILLFFFLGSRESDNRINHRRCLLPVKNEQVRS